jgi:Zn-dependent peptidase ImmA (M78 family)
MSKRKPIHEVVIEKGDAIAADLRQFKLSIAAIKANHEVGYDVIEQTAEEYGISMRNRGRRMHQIASVKNHERRRAEAAFLRDLKETKETLGNLAKKYKISKDNATKLAKLEGINTRERDNAIRREACETRKKTRPPTANVADMLLCGDLSRIVMGSKWNGQELRI